MTDNKNAAIRPALFAQIRFAENPEPRASCVFVVDSATLVATELQQAMVTISELARQLAADDVAARSVEVAVVTSGDPLVASDFQMVGAFQQPNLENTSDGDLATAIRTGIAHVTARKQVIRDQGLQLYRPSVVIFVNSVPAAALPALAECIRDGDGKREFYVIAVAGEGADVEQLKRLTVMEPLPMEGLQLRQLLPWIG